MPRKFTKYPNDYVRANSAASASIYNTLALVLKPIFDKLGSDINGRIDNLLSTYSIDRSSLSKILIKSIPLLDIPIYWSNRKTDGYFEFYCEPDTNNSYGGPCWFWITSPEEAEIDFDDKYDYIEGLSGAFCYDGNLFLMYTESDCSELLVPNGKSLAAYFDYYFNVLNPSVDFDTAISSAKDASNFYANFIADICNNLLDKAEPLVMEYAKPLCSYSEALANFKSMYPEVSVRNEGTNNDESGWIVSDEDGFYVISDTQISHWFGRYDQASKYSLRQY